MPDEQYWDDKPKDECGLFGIYGPGLDVARQTYFGLYALQHRGQESAGIAVTSGQDIDLYKDMGLVAEVFNDRILEGLVGTLAIGHVRYSTTGSSSVTNAQPLVFRYRRGVVAVAHNGNLTNAQELRQMLSSTGSIFQSTTDTEVIGNLIARHGQGTIEDALLKCVDDCKGAYSLLFMTPDKLIGLRDPHGIRPLCVGKLGNSYIICSESCALDTVGAEFIRDVAPGEMVVIDKDGMHSIQTIKARKQALCIFELVYLARPDSVIDGQTVYLGRQEMGRQLAKEKILDADMVIAVPDSGTAAAMGYAEASGIPFTEGLMKNRYSGRTFIQPSQKMRDQGVRLKLNPIRQLLRGKRVILVDDSIVRGTTSKQIVQMLRDAGVQEVHMLVSSPPILYPCYYGIDTSGQGELIAAQQNIEQIRQYIQADSLHYLSLEGMLGAMSGNQEGFCVACFNGKYPVKIPDPVQAGKFALEEEVS
ncbi:MAG: amidophosphoribosyltransferase [Bacillota bacterium]